METLQSTEQSSGSDYTSLITPLSDTMSEEIEDPLSREDTTSKEGKTGQVSGITDMLAQGYEDESNSQTQKNLSESLGDVTSLDDKLLKGLGDGIDGLVPNVGDAGSVQVNLNLPVGAGGLVSVGFEFLGSVTRTSSGLTLKVQAGGGVRGSTKTDLYLATFEAFAQAKVFGYMETAAANGVKSFEQILLGIHHQINGVSEEVAGWLFTDEQIEGFTAGMRDDDYVEQGLGLEVSAGASLSVEDGDEDDGDSSVDLSVRGGTTAGTRLTKNDDGLDEDETRTVTGGTKLIASPFIADGSLTGRWVNGKMDSIKGAFTGDAMVSVEDLNAALVGTQWFSGMFNSISDCITGASGLLDDANAARKVGSLASFVVGNSGLGVGAEVGTQKALKGLSDFNGVSIGHRLNVDVGWSDSKGMEMKISLGRVSKIAFGDAPTDTVYVALENLQELFHLEASAKG